MLTLSASTTRAAGGAAIVPLPRKITMTDGGFRLDESCVIVADAEVTGEAEFLAVQLAGLGKLKIAAVTVEGGFKKVIELRTSRSDNRFGKEDYLLEITPTRITLLGGSPAGVFYAVQTLLQLLPVPTNAQILDDGSKNLPCLTIEDSPRFRWRGVMLDVSRHFMPKEFVLKFIDQIALHKLNVLHLHLTDDQGWRLEIQKYPKLTEIGAWRSRTLVGRAMQNPGDLHFDPSLEEFDEKPHGGFYTQEDAREIVAYAASRHIMVVPEIEMPGHAQAAVAAYPELGCTGPQLEVSSRWGIHSVLLNPSEETISFMQDVLSEVLEIFPAPFIHIGGDEAIKSEWENSDQCQSRIKELGLKDEEQLQSYFIGRMDDFLRSNGRRLIGWDEISSGDLATDAVVMSWRGETGGVIAAEMGHDVVMAPHYSTYLDYYQNEIWENEPLAFKETLPLSKVYEYEPLTAGIPQHLSHHIMGAQAQLWTEYMPTPEQVEYMAFPRLSALAEVLWIEREAKDYTGFLLRLEKHLERLKSLNVHYRPLDRPRTGTMLGSVGQNSYKQGLSK